MYKKVMTYGGREERGKKNLKYQRGLIESTILDPERAGRDDFGTSDCCRRRWVMRRHARRRNGKRCGFGRRVRERCCSDGDNSGGVEVAWPGRSEPCGHRSKLTLPTTIVMAATTVMAATAEAVTKKCQKIP